MIEKILTWASRHPSVAAVVRTGSRARDSEVDALSDHDLALFVDDPGPLADDTGWFHAFGSVLVWIPETVDHLGRAVDTRLVLYEDGTKVDFTLSTADILRELSEGPPLPPWLDAGYEVLHDRDGIAGRLPPARGRGHVPDPPDARRFEARVREFWWETTYVARNLARREPLAARYSLDVVIRHELLREMLEWYAQGQRPWTTPVGAVGRGLPGRLSPEDRTALEGSLEDGPPDRTGRALRRTLELYARVARSVARRLGYSYPAALEAGVRTYLETLLQRGSDTAD